MATAVIQVRNDGGFARVVAREVVVNCVILDTI